MTRDEAINSLAQRDLTQLSFDKRESILLDWWSIDESDPDYASLPDSLRAALNRTDQPDDPGSTLYDPLLQIALRRSYVGVLNTYLAKKLSELGCNETVSGDVEDLNACPCCGYRSLQRSGEYDICPVCFWEDDGTVELDRISGPNHMTLREAILNFRTFGAVAEGAVKYVLTDGKERYGRE